MNSHQDQNAVREPIFESSGHAERQDVLILKWLGRHARLSIMLVAALAVIISSYPVIFCGKSYVSPAVIKPLVYNRAPWAPGMDHVAYTSHHESDTGAMMWWGVPAGFIESRSILDHGEIPLWNRYGHAGDILLGQAVSMLGDPLQLIVIFGRGSALAWDAKFLLAKLLFCLGFGWLVLRLLNSPGLSVIYAALAAYCGAYIYIYNHPAFFVLAYAPWILLSAVEMLACRPRGTFKWLGVWLVANASCFNAGHVEMAVVLIGGLNFAALVFALMSGANIPDRRRVLIRLGGGTLLFLGLTAPMWMAFMVALPQAYTVHEQIKVTQLSPKGILGLFDDCFYHWDWIDYGARGSPGTSLLVLAGCILSVRRWRHVRAEPFLLVNTGANIFWAGCVFGLIPASIIAAVPLLNRVGHVQVDFSYLLVIHLTLQSAYGFKSLLKSDSFRQATEDFVAVASIMGGMFMVYHLVSLAEEYQLGYLMPALTGAKYHLGYFIPCAAGAIAAPALFKYLFSKFRRIGLPGWAGIILLAFIPNFRFGLYNFGDEDLMILPGPRAVLNIPLETLNRLGTGGEPFRIAGLGNNFTGDYSAVYGLEDIRSSAPLSNAKYIQLMQSSPGITLTNGDWMLRLIDPGKAQPLLNLLNVKYVLANPHTPPPDQGDFTISDSPDFTIMQNNQAWPRAFLASQIRSFSSDADFTTYLAGHGDRPFVGMDREVVEQRPELRRLANESRPVIIPAEHYQLLPNSTAFDIQATGPGVVCLTEGLGRDFSARANGQSAEILTVNRAFKGIYLAQAGSYHVEFRYRPRYWNTSLSLFWLSAGVLLILGAGELRRAGGPSGAATSPSK